MSKGLCAHDPVTVPVFFHRRWHCVLEAGLYACLLLSWCIYRCVCVCVCSVLVTRYMSAAVTSSLCSHTPSGWPLWLRLVMSVCYRSPHSALEHGPGKLPDLCAIRLVVISCASALRCPVRMVQLSVLCHREARAVCISPRLPSHCCCPLSK